MLKYLLTVILIFIISVSIGYSQTKTTKTSKIAGNDIVISIDTVKVQKSTSTKAVIPVRVKNFKNIGAITIKIAFDTLNVQFNSISNIAGITTANYGCRNGVVTLGWFDPSGGTSGGANIADGVFFDLNFTLSGDKSDLKFIVEDCDIADANAVSQKVTYINGAVLPGNTAAEEIKKKSIDFKLGQNYPNPFNPETSIEYYLPKGANVKLKVFDLLGQEIATLIDQFKAEGKYKVNFLAQNLPSGIYLYKLEAGEYAESRKMVLAK